MLSRTLLHIYGPICIYSFGAIIALGCIIIYRLLVKDQTRIKLIDTESLLNVFSLSIITAIVGGRLLYMITSYNQIQSITDIFALHEGGLSILGAIIAILCILPWYLKKINVPTLPFLDLISLYAPLLQAISRFGCFFAGCCYGKPTDVPWGITYKTHDTLAPTFCKLHPTQLYMACGDALIFLILFHFAQARFKKPGQLLCLYLCCSSLNRFLVDFWRDDQEFLPIQLMRIFSLHQWIALGIIISSIACFIVITRKDRIV
jgi:phosphatidylglycerol:prolipoprotein diacylglycerol transferase